MKNKTAFVLAILIAFATVPAQLSIQTNQWVEKGGLQSIVPSQYGSAVAHFMSWGEFEYMPDRGIVFSTGCINYDGNNCSLYDNTIWAYNVVDNTRSVLENSHGGWYRGNKISGFPYGYTWVDRHVYRGSAYDPENHEVYFVKGAQTRSSDPSMDINEVWVYNVDTKSWRQSTHAPSKPGPYEGHLVFDTDERVMYYLAQEGASARKALIALDLDSPGPWVTKLTNNTGLPGHFNRGNSFYDSVRKQVVFIGNVEGTIKLGAYHPASNTFSILSNSVPDNSTSIAFDTKNDLYISVAGGRTHAYDPDAGTWSNLGISAPDIEAAMLVYDSVNDVIVAKDHGNSPDPLYLLRLDLGTSDARPAIAVQSRPELALSATPNPFSGATVVHVSFANHAASFDMGVYDIQGKLVRKLSSGKAPQNVRTAFNLNLDNLPGGIYLLKARIDNTVHIKQLILMK